MLNEQFVAMVTGVCCGAGKKKKVPVGPPSIGPWIAKLSLKANDIHYNPHVLDPSAFECIQMCAR